MKKTTFTKTMTRQLFATLLLFYIARPVVGDVLPAFKKKGTATQFVVKDHHDRILSSDRCRWTC